MAQKYTLLLHIHAKIRYLVDLGFNVSQAGKVKWRKGLNDWRGSGLNLLSLEKPRIKLVTPALLSQVDNM